MGNNGTALVGNKQRGNPAVPSAIRAELPGILLVMFVGGDRIKFAHPENAGRAAVARAFGQTLPSAFGYAALVLAVAFVLTLFLRVRELRTMAHSDAVGITSTPNPQGAPDD